MGAVLCSAWALWWLPGSASAAQILAVHVTRHGTHFGIVMRIALDAPSWAVFEAMQDYAAMKRYNPDLRRVRIERTSRPDRVRLFATVHTCVLVFCRTLHQEQIMTATANARGGVLRASLVPHRGDFRSGHARWSVEPCAAGQAPSCLDVKMELQPAFWVPPLIGPWILRRKMYEEARRSAFGLEQIARKRLAGSAGPQRQPTPAPASRPSDSRARCAPSAAACRHGPLAGSRWRAA